MHLWPQDSSRYKTVEDKHVQSCATCPTAVFTSRGLRIIRTPHVSTTASSQHPGRGGTAAAAWTHLQVGALPAPLVCPVQMAVARLLPPYQRSGSVRPHGGVPQCFTPRPAQLTSLTRMTCVRPAKAVALTRPATRTIRHLTV